MEKICREELLECTGGGLFGSIATRLILSLINLTKAVVLIRRIRR